jgi:hypothetical protein
VSVHRIVELERFAKVPPQCIPRDNRTFLSWLYIVAERAHTLPLFRPLPVFLLISAAAALQSGRKSRAAAEMCGSCSLTAFTVIVKGAGHPVDRQCKSISAYYYYVD